MKTVEILREWFKEQPRITDLDGNIGSYIITKSQKSKLMYRLKTLEEEKR